MCNLRRFHFFFSLEEVVGRSSCDMRFTASRSRIKLKAEIKNKEMQCETVTTNSPLRSNHFEKVVVRTKCPKVLLTDRAAADKPSRMLNWRVCNCFEIDLKSPLRHACYVTLIASMRRHLYILKLMVDTYKEYFNASSSSMMAA